MEGKNELKIKSLWKDYSKEIFAGKGDSLVDVLHKIPLFNKLNKHELKIVSKFAYERSYEPEEFVFQAGQPGAAMFMIKEGEISIVKKNNENEFVEIARLKEGEVFGELALLDSSPRSAGALALTHVKAIAIFREDLNNLLETHPDIGGRIMQYLAIITGKRLKETTNLLIQLEDKLTKLKENCNEG
jgi:CRP-like cAMP-binding protein